MKYFKKFVLLGIFALCWVCFCNAEVITFSNWGWGSIASNSTFTINPNSCILFTNPSCASKSKFFDTNNNEITATKSTYALICNTYNTNITYQNTYTSSCSTYYFSWLLTQIQDLKTCPTCPDQYTSLQCQTEYNLIPIEDVTKNYCEVNFDLIDPLDCPSSPSWSGDVSRSALYIDNVQYSGAPNIYININDLLEYSMTYVSGSAVIDVNGYSYDTWYMADILTIQEYHPTSEDFTTSFVSFLTFALPYVVVILFVVFVRKLIRKIFKF